MVHGGYFVVYMDQSTSSSIKTDQYSCDATQLYVRELVWVLLLKYWTFSGRAPSKKAWDVQFCHDSKVDQHKNETDQLKWLLMSLHYKILHYWSTFMRCSDALNAFTWASFRGKVFLYHLISWTQRCISIYNVMAVTCWKAVPSRAACPNSWEHLNV